MSRNSLPPGMKISFCVGRSAPPDSTSETVGSPFSSAICEARKTFLTVHGLEAPPFTEGSLAVIMHSTPSTTPMPVTTEAPTVKSEPHPASGDSSRNADPGSTSSSIRSRGSSLPRRVVAGDVLLATTRDGDRVLGVEVGELVEHRLTVPGG